MCSMCLDKPKYGGPGKKKQCCIKQKCINLMCKPVSTVTESASTCEPAVEKLIKTLHTEAIKLGTQCLVRLTIYDNMNGNQYYM